MVAEEEKTERWPPESPDFAHSVLHYALADALKKVTPFMAVSNESREQLKHVWFEAGDGKLTVTTSDGYCIAHATLGANWPDGQWLLEGTACKRLASSPYKADMEVQVQDDQVTVGEHTLPVMGTSWVEYQRLYEDVQAGMQAMVVVGRRPLQKVIREHGGAVIGLRVSAQDTRVYVAREDSQDYGLETVACEVLQVQMASGAARSAFDKDKLSRAVRHGEWFTLKLQGEGKPALIEGTDYWQVLMPLTTFPSEVNFSQAERESLEWAIEMMRSIRKGQVQATVQLGQGGMAVSWEPQPERTTITFQEGE